MKIKKETVTLLKKVVKKATKDEHDEILTHSGFSNDLGLTRKQRITLDKLAHEMNRRKISLSIEDLVLTAGINGYHGGTVLSGIKINKIIKI